MSRSTNGSDERALLPCVRAYGYAVAPRGIVRDDCPTQETGGTNRHILRFWDAATGQDRELATVTTDVIASLSVSPDGRSLVYGGGQFTSDLMLIEISASAAERKTRRRSARSRRP